ncbi:hypothetical protein [Thiomicrospira sp. WB1]|uniref:hypothetical protein n=1 Tax=Thiomicrospira sp. WB1 TaxID=1685380 RepID=UPI0007481993|nr:hypothetical protein [Thiomicrospira sp. WB1]KUJ72319.1 hypothetical protein AVO41_00435 [Thiomicrospira sp. WB1]
MNLIIAEYSDRDYEPMNHGGHGRMAFAITPDQHLIKLPRVDGHSFHMPKGSFILEPHRNPKRDKAGAYMPPCSGAITSPSKRFTLMAKTSSPSASRFWSWALTSAE